MALAVVQSTTVPSSGAGNGVLQGVSSGAVTFVSTPTANNLIVVVITLWDSSVAVSSVTDNKGNTYTQAYQVESGNARTAIYYTENIATGATHTVTVTASGTLYGAFSAVEVSGASTSSSRDTGAQATNVVDLPTSSTSASVVSNALAQADEIVFAAHTHDRDAAITNPGAPWTAIYNRNDYNNDHVGAAVYQIVSSTSAMTSTWTFALLAGNTTRASGITAFKAALAVEASSPVAGMIGSVNASVGKRTRMVGF